MPGCAGSRRARCNAWAIRVETALSGAEGVEKAKAAAYDLIAVDHFMPGQDGLATLAELRALPDAPPIVYVTGSEESRIAVAALKAGAVDYVVKSIGEDFFSLLDSAFTQALATRRLAEEKTALDEDLRQSNARLETLAQGGQPPRRQFAAAGLGIRPHAVAALPDPVAQGGAAGYAAPHPGGRAGPPPALYGGDGVDAVAMDDYLAALVEELAETWSTPARAAAC